ncbi:MAG: hypothetical protein VX871_12245 [Pseudomonadota bacterium]|nr:hypothetical protein [Pseudomonadota bacterium]
MLILVALAAVFPAGPLAAAPQGKSRVTAFSHYGNGSVTGAVRPTWWGHEVQTPKGSWLDCKGDCREELRKWSLDFWETRNEDAPGRDRD